MKKPKVIHKSNMDHGHHFACGGQFVIQQLRDHAPSTRLWKHVTCKDCLRRLLAKKEKGQ